MKRKSYQKVLEMQPTNFEAKNNLQAIVVLCHLGKTSRQLFSDYFEESGKSSPAPLLGNYLTDHGVSSIGLRMGLQTKELILEGLRTSKHKTALLGAVGQAHLDLCMSVAIAEYCQKGIKEELPYDEYLSLSEKAINTLVREIENIQKAFKNMDFSYYCGDLKLILDSPDSSETIRATALQRIRTAVDIIVLWKKSKLEYDEEYSDIEEYVKQKSKENVQIENGLEVLPLIYCVQQNRSEFTQEEIAIATAVFADCHSEAVNVFKRDPKCSTIGDAKSFLSERSGKVNKEDIEKFKKESEKKEAKQKAKATQIKLQQEKQAQEKLAQEQAYQQSLLNWAKDNETNLAIGYAIVQSENRENLLGEEPFEFLKSLIGKVSKEINLEELDLPENYTVDKSYESWCISTTMPRRSN